MSRTHFVSDKYRVKMLLTHLPGQNGHHFRWRHFQMHFHEWKILHFGLNLFPVVQLTKTSIGSGDGLKPLTDPTLVQFTDANMRH